MGLSIAFSGKGGTGKTTLCGMLIRYMLQKDMAPLLAVDADPNYNLNEVLGVEVEKTLGQVREQMKQGDVPSGMTKDRFMSMKLEEAIVESQGFDLVVMGQPEGQGCYCAANTLLSDFLYKLSDNYAYIIMDNEAGMEHISRLTTSNIDYLLVASDPSKRGLQAAQRIQDLARTLPVHIKNMGLILNNVQQEPAGKMLQLIQDTGLELLGSIYMDQGVQEFDLQGKPTFELPADNPALNSAFSIFDRILAA
ncbi:MAG: AAA family ATPase [Desulfohalobiaceae bacterium]